MNTKRRHYNHRSGVRSERRDRASRSDFLADPLRSPRGLANAFLFFLAFLALFWTIGWMLAKLAGGG